MKPLEQLTEAEVMQLTKEELQISLRKYGIPAKNLKVNLQIQMLALVLALKSGETDLLSRYQHQLQKLQQSMAQPLTPAASTASQPAVARTPLLLSVARPDPERA